MKLWGQIDVHYVIGYRKVVVLKNKSSLGERRNIFFFYMFYKQRDGSLYVLPLLQLKVFTKPSYHPNKVICTMFVLLKIMRFRQFAQGGPAMSGYFAFRYQTIIKNLA